MTATRLGLTGAIPLLAALASAHAQLPAKFEVPPVPAAARFPRLVPIRPGAALAEPPKPAAVVAPEMPPPPPEGTVVTRKPALTLPIVLDEPSRAELSAVALYVRRPGQEWREVGRGKPDQSEYPFKAGDDGDYEFFFATFDKGGRRYPVDLAGAEPQRRVRIDTTPPSVKLQSAEAAGGKRLLVIRADDPAGATVKRVEIGPESGPFQTVTQAEGLPDQYPFPEGAGRSVVRVSVEDGLGNAGVREFDVNPGAPTKPPAPAVTPAESPTPLIVVPPEPQRGPIVAVAQAEPAEELPPVPDLTAVAEARPASPPLIREPDAPLPVPGEFRVNVPKPVAHSAARMVSVPFEEPKPSTEAVPPISLPEGVVPAFVASRRLRVEYDAPADTKVAVWLTRDGGRTWSAVRDDGEGRSPAQVRVPEDGLYGLAIRAGREADIGPRDGEKPDQWVEVDTAPPTVSVFHALGEGENAVTLKWAVSDRRPSEVPVRLSYATRPDGEWLPLPVEAKTEGSRRWDASAGLSGTVYFRLEAADRAGNMTRKTISVRMEDLRK